MRRTQENTEITRHFTGIQEVGAEFGSRIDEIHGMYDKSMTSLTRIPGKLLMTTGIASGPIWNLHQLKFQDGSVRLSKEGGNYQAERFELPPSGSVFPPFSMNNYSLPGFQVQDDDWPVGSIVFDMGTDLILSTQDPVIVMGRSTENLSFDPSSLSFVPADFESGNTSKDTTLISDNPKLGFESVQLTWDEGFEWLIVKVGGVEIENGGVFVTTWTDGSLSEKHQTITIDVSGAGAGTHNIKLKAATVYPVSGAGTYFPIYNPDGSAIEADLTIYVDTRWTINDVLYVKAIISNETHPSYSGAQRFYIYRQTELSGAASWYKGGTVSNPQFKISAGGNPLSEYNIIKNVTHLGKMFATDPILKPVGEYTFDGTGLPAFCDPPLTPPQPSCFQYRVTYARQQ